MNYKVPLVKPVQKDYDEIEDKPIEDVIVEKKDGDIYEWNLIFHIENVKEGDSFNDQLYFGQITFPQAYPFEPPTIKICKIPNIEAPKKPLYLPITEDWRFCTARQVILNILDAIKTFCKTRELLTDPDFQYLQDDLFYDIFKFLDREHIEKCQIVCNVWKSFLQMKSDVLPRRKFGALVIINETVSLRAKIVQNSILDGSEKFYKLSDKDEEIYSNVPLTFDSNKIRALKNSFFEKVLLIAHGHIWPAETILDLLRSIIDKTEQKIRTVKYIDKINDFDLSNSYSRPIRFGIPRPFSFWNPLPLGINVRPPFRNILPQPQHGNNNFPFPNLEQPAPQFPINNARYTTQLYPHIFEYIHAENFYKHIIPSEMDSIMGRSEAFRLPIPPSFVELSVWEEQPIWLHDQLDNAILIGLTTVDRMFDCLVQLQDRNVQRFNLVTIYENFDQHVYDLVAKVLSNFITVMDPTMLPSKIQINFHEHVYLQSEFITNLRQENSSSNTTFEVQSGPNFRRIIFQRQDRWKLSIELQRYTEGNNGHFKLEIIDS